MGVGIASPAMSPMPSDDEEFEGQQLLCEHHPFKTQNCRFLWHASCRASALKTGSCCFNPCCIANVITIAEFGTSWIYTQPGTWDGGSLVTGMFP